MKTVIMRRTGKKKWEVGIYSRDLASCITEMGIRTAKTKKKYALRLAEKREFKDEQEAQAYHDELCRQTQAV